jgi:hypothetical protein
MPEVQFLVEKSSPAIPQDLTGNLRWVNGVLLFAPVERG